MFKLQKNTRHQLIAYRKRRIINSSRAICILLWLYLKILETSFWNIFHFSLKGTWVQNFTPAFLHIFVNPLAPNAAFLYPWKHQKTLRISDVLTGQRKGALETNGLNLQRKNQLCAVLIIFHEVTMKLQSFQFDRNEPIHPNVHKFHLSLFLHIFTDFMLTIYKVVLITFYEVIRLHFELLSCVST